MNEILEGVLNHENPNRLGDVVFIHGMQGDRRLTWQLPNQPDTFWPEWIGRRLPEYGVWTLGYDADWSDWRGKAALPLSQRAHNVLECMAVRGFEGRPLVMIAHSMGGLVAKMLLQQAELLGQDDLERVVKNVRGIVFFATPHLGAPAAGRANWIVRRVPELFRVGPLLAELVEGNPELLGLHGWFQREAPKRGIRVLPVREHKSVRHLRGLIRTMVVPEIHSDPGLGVPVLTATGKDHFDIVKFRNENDSLFLKTERVTREWLRSPTTPKRRTNWIRPFSSMVVHEHQADIQRFEQNLDRRKQWGDLLNSLQSGRDAVIFFHGSERQRLGRFLDRVRELFSAGETVRAHRVVDVSFDDPMICLRGTDWLSSINLALHRFNPEGGLHDRMTAVLRHAPLLLLLGENPLAELGPEELGGLKEFLSDDFPNLLAKLPEEASMPVRVMVTLRDASESESVVDELREAALESTRGAVRKIVVPEIEMVVLPDEDEVIREVKEYLQESGAHLSEQQEVKIRDATRTISGDPKASFYDLAEFIVCFLAGAELHV